MFLERQLRSQFSPIEEVRVVIETLKDAEIQLLVNPSQQEFNQQL